MAKMLVVLLLLGNVVGMITGIRLDGNGYTDIVVAINPAVPENETLLNRIKEMITDGSKYLFQALDNKVFIKDVKILVPPDWKEGSYDRARTETYEKAKIKIDKPHPSYGDGPHTYQFKGCGEESEFTHFTPNFLLNNDLIATYGPRGRVFVHEWAHLRWGVFDEYDEKHPFYRRQSDNQIESTRCPRDITGQWKEYNDTIIKECHNDPQTNLPTKECEFFPDSEQSAYASIMFMQSMQSVTTFCREENHNHEAPNMQNKQCNFKSTHTVIFQDSVDKDALHKLQPLKSQPPAPTFQIIQRGHQAICLVLDVSGSMQDSRILQQQQAATLFLKYIVQDQARVGLVTFSSDASVLSQLVLVNDNAQRNALIKKLPTVANGYTYICKGLQKGLEVLQNYKIGGEIIFLTDGQATDDLQSCLPSALSSGAIIHTIAFGPQADPTLLKMANQTDGKFVVANDDILSNQLVDAFSSLTSSDGNPTKQTIQLESIGHATTDWFNGTLPIDQTVGNITSFTIIYERSSPRVYIESPSGTVYTQAHVTDTANTISVTIPGTAEPGTWKYSFLNTGTQSQAITLTVTSRAANQNVPPIMVKAQMNQLSSDGTKPMRVFAEVSQNNNPVLGAEVWAYLQSDTGNSEKLQLLDNGAAADILKNDGVYSRYFTKLNNGKYSLKVRVTGINGTVSFSPNRHSSALYVPGYIVDGEVKPNPPKPPVNVPPVEVGSFTRTTTGESFVVNVPKGTTPPKFPPNKITDLTAEIQVKSKIVLLNWTAPGEDFDQGTVTYYEIRWSQNLQMILNNFSDAHFINTSGLLPQESGSAEHFSFIPEILISNGTTLFFAVQSEDKDSMKSDVSNIARVTNFVPSPDPITPAISNPGLNLTAIIVSICVVAALICLIAIVIIVYQRKKYAIMQSNANANIPPSTYRMF